METGRSEGDVTALHDGKYLSQEDEGEEGGAAPVRRFVGRRQAVAAAKDDSLWGGLCELILQHQIGLSVNLLLLLSLVHATLPRARPTTRKFFELSYREAATGRYTQGWDDMAFVGFWVVIFTGMRVAVMDHVLMPLAEKGGVRKKKDKVRFVEQGWLLCYCSVFWTLGVYIMYNSEYWFNLPEMWTNFPTRSMNGLLKWYYLVQFGFWIQQIIVVNIEEKRKDYAQMFTHHIVTCALIFFSYGFYQTKVGNVILCIMDIVDIILPAAKLLKYLGYSAVCDVAFGVFIFTWTVTRHVFYLMVCWSIVVDVPGKMPYGCYNSGTGELLKDRHDLPADGGSEILRWVVQPFSDPGGVVCFNNSVRLGFLGLLLSLQVMLLLWFTMICRIAYKVVTGQGAEDVRSDDEDDFSEEDLESLADPPRIVAQKENVTLPHHEEEVGVESLSFIRKSSPGVGVSMRGRSSRRSGRASGISIPGHGDHKELLGRIGCDKPN